jgi:hypothetical protein
MEVLSQNTTRIVFCKTLGYPPLTHHSTRSTRKTFFEVETMMAFMAFPNIYALLDHAKTQGLTQESLFSSIQKPTARKNIIAVAKHIEKYV